MSEQWFGGRWTQIKLNCLEMYISAYTVALKKQGFELVYIDGFAGSGSWKPKDGVSKEGSARLALKYPFDKYYFVEIKPELLGILSTDVSADAQGRAVEFLHGDANTIVPQLLKEGSSKSRYLLFLDPYKMDVPWSTLEEISKIYGVDIWYLFPLSAAIRNLPINMNAADKGKSDAITNLVGTDDWIDLYIEQAQQQIFSDPDFERSPGVGEFTKFLTKRLKRLFPVVANPLILRNSKNGPVFSLYFLHNSDSNKAKGLSLKLANAILQNQA